jgi:phage/plasmid-like protein (TIGR03299 family)
VRNTVTGRLIDGKRAIYRTDTLDTLGIGSDGYKVIAPADMLRPAAYLFSDTGLGFHSAGAFDNGARVWLQAAWPGEYQILGESHRAYFTVQSGNDGGQSLRLGHTDVRIVCANTYAAARGDLAVTVRHSGDVAVKLITAADLLKVVSTARERLAAWAEKAAAIKISKADYAAFEVALFKLAADAVPADDKRIQVFRPIFSEEYRAAGQINAWVLFNSVTGYADHGMRTRGGAAGRWDSVLNGAAAQFKARGVAMVETLVK